jgi:DNA-binding transcriptional ArsR family regulator
LAAIMKETYEIKDLETVRLLSDPLKLRILQAFADSAKTTKQVATELGEPITKLYRHVDALHDSNLLEVVGERQKRGTIERTFRAVARRFEVDHSLFSGESADTGADAVREVLRASETEILNALANFSDDPESRMVFARVRGKASPEIIAELQEKLNEWMQSMPGDDQAPADDAREYGGLIAFYPIE